MRGADAETIASTASENRIRFPRRGKEHGHVGANHMVLVPLKVVTSGVNLKRLALTRTKQLNSA